MNKAFARTLFPVVIMVIGAAFALALAPSRLDHANALSHTPQHSTSLAPYERQLRVPYQPATPTPTSEAKSQPGSTDGIMIMGLAIVVLIVVPILLQRSLWMK